MSAINNLSSSYLQSILSSALQNAGLNINGTSNSVSGVGASSVATPSDNGQLSPLAQMMSTLQQLQQSNPAKYQQVTQQIATNLQSAAQTAQSDGNTAAANQLNQLATDFTNATKSGQLPNVQGLGQAISGHHHHHSRSASADSDSNSGSGSSSSGSSSSNSSSSSSASQTLTQFLVAFQTNGGQSDALNPVSIILNTLANAGIGSNG